jgi:hypothetical protein
MNADDGEYLPELHRAIEGRRKQARALIDGRALPARLALMREALVFAVRARTDPKRALGPGEAATELAALAAPHGALAGDVLSASSMSFTADDLADLDETVRWLERGYDARSPDERRLQRVLRLTAVGVALASILAFAIIRAVLPENVAYGKPVALSSHRDATPQPSTLVDGKRRAHATSASNADGTAWASIDLRGKFSIDKVVVYNGRDSSHDDVLPLVLELSDDGHEFHEVGVRDGTFTDRRPWAIRLSGEQARFVRLRVQRALAAIALSEVEVYGRRLD